MTRQEERHVVSAALYCSPRAKKVLRSRFNVAHHIYNCFLGESNRRRKLYTSCNNYKQGVELLKTDNKAESKKFFNEAIKESGWYIQSSSKNDKNNSLEQYASRIIENTWLAEHIDSATRNKLMERAFAATQRAHKGKKKKNKRTGFYEKPKIKFKKFGRDFIMSVEGKNPKSPLRLKNDKIVWKDLVLPFIRRPDQKLEYVLKNPHIVTYVRLKRKMVGNDWLYFADLVCEGKPIVKSTTKLGTGVIGADVGPSTIAYVTDEIAVLREITSLDNKSYKKVMAQQRVLARKIDRQRRQNNPNNFNSDGTVKKSCKIWKTSKRQKDTQKELAEIQRKISENRKCEHYKLISDMRSVGNVLKLDKDSYKGWQQSGYGRSIGKHAPGQLIALAEQKFSSTNGTVHRVDTFKSKSSQTCPNCGKIQKKGNGQDSRSVRIHECICGFKMQRDVTSAIVNKYVDDKNTLCVDESKKFIKDKKPILQACIQGLIQSVRVGQSLPSTFGTTPELERIACDGDESAR